MEDHKKAPDNTNLVYTQVVKLVNQEYTIQKFGTDEDIIVLSEG